jgi:hypothetical protein
MPPKVVQLPFNVVEMLIHRGDLTVQAVESLPGAESPESSQRQLLSTSVLDALKAARDSKTLIGGGRNHVTLSNDQCTELSGFLRTLADEKGTSEAERATLRGLAEMIDRA